MKKIILTVATAFACLINFNGLFGAANGDQPENMDEIIQRYDAAQSLQSPSSSSEPSSSSSTTLFDDADARKRTGRSESDNQGKPPKCPRINESRAESLAERNQRYRLMEERAIAKRQELFRQALAQALAQADTVRALDLLQQLIYLQQNPDELVNTPEFNTFLHSNQLSEYVSQTVSNLALEPDNRYNLHNLQTLYSFSAQNPELHDRLKHILQHLLLFVDRDNRITIVHSNLAQNSFSFIQGLYDLGLLHSPERQDPLNPQKVNLPDLSANSIERLILFIMRISFWELAHQAISPGDTTEQRAAKITDINSRHAHINALFYNLTLQDLQELIHTATYLGLSQSLYLILANQILFTVAGTRFNGSFDLLNSLPPYMRKALAAASKRVNPIRYGPIQPIGYGGPEAHDAYLATIISWQSSNPFFLDWRKSALNTSIFDLIAQDEIPAITVTDGLNTLNLENRSITNLEGLAAIPGIEKVEELNLAGTSLKFIPANAFSAMPNLRVLNLSHLNLSDTPYFTRWNIKANVFTGLNKLERLDLSGNLFANTEIYLNSFNHLPALKYLNMRGNNITPDRRNQIHEKIRKVTGDEPTIEW